MCQHAGNATQFLRALLAHLDDAAALLEIVHAQRRAEASRAAGRQHVVGPGTVVAQALAGVGAEEDRPRMLEQRVPAVRFAAADLQVLGRDAVADGTGLFHAGRLDQRTTAVQALGDDLGAGHFRQQAINGGLHLIDIGRIRAQQDGLRQFIMFGLAEQIHRHPFSGSAAIGQHQNLARAGNHVDAHGAEHAALGAGHIGIAGAGDLVHLGDGGCAIGQCGHGLRAADGKGTRNTRHISRCQHQRIAFAARRRHHHDDVFHASHMRRNRVHQHGGWIGGLATRHIDAHAVQRRDLLAQQRAVRVAIAPALSAGALLRLVIAADPGRRSLQCVLLHFWQAVECRLQFILLQLQFGHVAHLQAIETRRVFQHRGITTLLHVGQDVGHTLLDLGIGIRAPVQTRLEGGLEIRLGGGQAKGFGLQVAHSFSLQLPAFSLPWQKYRSGGGSAAA